MSTREDGPADRPDPEETDRRFREIIDGLRDEPAEAPVDEGGPQWPEVETGRVNPPLGPPPGRQPGMATDHRSYSPPEDPDEDHFVPPPTPPLPAGDLHFWAILVGLVGGPLLVLLSAVFPILPMAWTAVGAVVTLAGFVLLVLRQPRRREHDGDLGAQV